MGHGDHRRGPCPLSDAELTQLGARKAFTFTCRPKHMVGDHFPITTTWVITVICRELLPTMAPPGRPSQSRPQAAAAGFLLHVDESLTIGRKAREHYNRLLAARYEI